jgi:prepilin-type N-terminal cleavage/methylation domain-containing protein
MIIPHLKPLPSFLRRGYTLVEVLMGSALLGLAIGGAVSMTATMNVQHVAAFTGAVAQNYQDNAARLWQLGLSPTEVLAVMPHVTDNADLQNAIVPTGTGTGSQVSFGTSGTTTLANSMGTLENVPCTVTIRNPVGAANRTLTLQVYRPTLR